MGLYTCADPYYLLDWGGARLLSRLVGVCQGLDSGSYGAPQQLLPRPVQLRGGAAPVPSMAWIDRGGPPASGTRGEQAGEALPGALHGPRAFRGGFHAKSPNPRHVARLASIAATSFVCIWTKLD